MYLTRDKEKYQKAIYHLWQEAFAEDCEYLQYYFEWRFWDTSMYMYVSDEDALLSMIHLNPLKLRIQGTCVRIPYIVGVATKPEYRKQGLMAGLMKQVLIECRQEKVPFVLLKTEHEEYYKSFGFQTVHQQTYYSMKKQEAIYDNADNAVIESEMCEFIMEPLLELEIARLAVWTQHRLQEQYAIYVEHDDAYLRRMQKEYQAQQGEFLVIKKAGRICGYLCYGWSEDEVVIQELQCEEELEKVFYLLQCYVYNNSNIMLSKAKVQKMPVTMAYQIENTNVREERIMEKMPSKETFSKMLFTDWV